MIQSFEDILSWQLSRELNKIIYQLTKSEGFKHDFSLKDQIRRASISVSSNIAEGHSRHSRKEFKHFLNISKASCSEVISQLYLALDINYITQDEFKQTKHLCNRIIKLISGLSKSL